MDNWQKILLNPMPETDFLVFKLAGSIFLFSSLQRILIQNNPDGLWITDSVHGWLIHLYSTLFPGRVVPHGRSIKGSSAQRYSSSFRRSLSRRPSMMNSVDRRRVGCCVILFFLQLNIWKCHFAQTGWLSASSMISNWLQKWPFPQLLVFLAGSYLFRLISCDVCKLVNFGVWLSPYFTISSA